MAEIAFHTFSQSQSFINAQISKLMGFKRKQMPNLPHVASVYIFNVSMVSHEWRQPGIFGAFSKKVQHVVPACPKGQRVSAPCEVDGLYVEEYLKGDETEVNIYNAVEIAWAIMRKGPGIDPQLNLETRGVFLSDSATPTEAEIDKAVARLTAHYEGVLRAADRFFSAGQLKEINEEAGWAAEFLGQKRDYAKNMLKMKECPGCFRPVPENAAVHYGSDGCGAVLDWPRAIALGLKKAEDAPIGIGMPAPVAAGGSGPGQAIPFDGEFEDETPPSDFKEELAKGLKKKKE